MALQSQIDYFASTKKIAPAPERKDPTFWIKNLALFEDAPARSCMRRRFDLHRGMNILWARPFDPDQADAETPVPFSGHAAGKTLFCRLLRYAIGEHYPASERVRDRLIDKFPDGWVGATVYINQEPWVTCRPIASRRGQFAVSGASLDDFLSDQAVERVTFSRFEAAMDEVVVDRLPIKELPNNGGEITMQHLLPWLSRDQEARFSGVADWRSAKSGAEPPSMDTEERHFLMRNVLHLIEVNEKPELDRNARLVKRKAELERRAPLLEYQARRDLERLRTSLHDEGIRDLPDALADDLFVDAVEQRLSGKVIKVEESLKSAPSFKAVELLQEKLVAASTARALAHKEKKTAEEQLQKAETDAAAWEIESFEAQMKEHYKALPLPDDLCLTPLAVAKERGCPCFSERPLDFEAEKGLLGMKAKAALLKDKVEENQRRIQELSQNLETAARAELLARTEYRSASADRDRALEEASRVKGDLVSLVHLAKRAASAQKEAAAARQEIQTLQMEINYSYENQKLLRKSVFRKTALFREIFEAICQFILGPSVEADVRLSGRSLSLLLSYNGDLDSAALETIKVLAFDLAALVSGLQGQSNFPRFLIHDGPREADMDPWLYRRLFYAVKEIEDACLPNLPGFQYIITTTEPPPEDLQNPQWLLQPVLDASKEELRLLGVNL